MARIIDIRGTHLRPPLTDGEVTELLAAANGEIIKNFWYGAIVQTPRLGQALSQRLYRECELRNGHLREAMSWISRRELIYLLLQALQFEERCRVRRLQKTLFDKVCTLIGLDVIIKRENLRRDEPEQGAFNDQLQELARQRRELREVIDVLVHWQTGMALKFEPAHADIINGFIDRMNTCRRQWQQMKANAVLAQPPTHEQIEMYRRLEVLEQRLNQIQEYQDRIDRLNDDRGSLNQLERTGGRLGPRQIEGVSEEIRDMVREIVRDETLDDQEREQIRAERRRILEQIHELRLQVQRSGTNEIRSEIRRLRNTLDRGGLRQRICQYLELADAEQFRTTQGRIRDQLLQDFESLVRRHTSRRLTTLGDGDKWQVYQGLLEGLITGIGVVSLEHIIADVFVGYGPVNSNRDVGLRLQDNTPPPALSISTYPGHGQRHALAVVDINTNDRLPFLAVAPDLLVLPARFGGQVEGRRDEQFEYVRLATVPSRTHTTNDLQDVFAKIAYGLLRPPGQGRTQSSDIERLMSDAQLAERLREERNAGENCDAIMTRETTEGGHEATLPPEVGRNPEAGRILAGLAYHNLTEARMAGVSERGLELLGRERQDILGALEDAVRRRLGEPDDVRIFREGGLRADERGVGLRNLVVLRDRFTDVVNAVAEEIRSRGNITARLWHFLWQLRGAGAPPSRAGQSVTVDYVYRSRRDPNRLIAVRVFNSHVSGVSSVSARCQQIGRVGTTGNAVSYHNHVEITVYPIETFSGQVRERDEIGSVLPHEFFPLF